MGSVWDGSLVGGIREKTGGDQARRLKYKSGGHVRENTMALILQLVDLESLCAGADNYRPTCVHFFAISVCHTPCGQWLIFKCFCRPFRPSDGSACLQFVGRAPWARVCALVLSAWSWQSIRGLELVFGRFGLKMAQALPTHTGTATKQHCDVVDSLRRNHCPKLYRCHHPPVYTNVYTCYYSCCFYCTLHSTTSSESRR